MNFTRTLIPFERSYLKRPERLASQRSVTFMSLQCPTRRLRWFETSHVWLGKRRTPVAARCLLLQCMILDYCPMMSDASGFTVTPAKELSDTEAKDAKNYWSSLAVPDFYKKPQTHWSDFIAEQVLRLAPDSVLEFGCNVGRNLAALRERAPSLSLKGIDINAQAIAFGRNQRGLDLLQADESFFQTQADNSFDVIFTVSVLDHLPDPEPVLGQMVRVSKRAVLLLEPSLEEEGKILKASQAENPNEATPFSYSWNYARLARDLPVEFSQEHYPLSGTLLGPYYWLFRLLKCPANQSGS